MARADTRYHQGGQTHQGQEHRGLLHKARHARDGIAAIVDLPDRIWESRRQRCAELFGRGGFARKGDTIGIIEQASRGDQLRARKSLARDQHARSQGEAAGDAVRLGDDAGADDKIGVADADGIARFHAEAHHERVFHHGAAA